MYFLKHFCCICLKHENNLKQLLLNNSENEEYMKLISSIPEMSFQELEENGKICAECCTKLDEAHRFREQCLRSKHLLMDYITKLRSVSEKSGVLNVCLQDYKNWLKIPLTNTKHFENPYDNTDELFSMWNSKYIVTAGEFVNNHDGNSLLMKTKTVHIGNQAGSSDTDRAVGKIHLDHMSPNNIGAITKNKFIIKSDPEDMSEYEVKTERNYPAHRESECSDPCESNCAVATDDVLDNKTNTDFMLTEEFDIKSEQEDISEYEDELETITAEDTECSGPSGSNCAVATDDVLDNKTNTDFMVTEEFDIKSKQEDISDYVDELETTTDDDTDVTWTPGKKHARTDTGSRQCLSNRSNLTDEKRSSKKRIACEQCEKTFSGNASLRKHKRCHIEDKLFKCDHCNKSFLYRNLLINHKRTHTGEKPFKCDQCDKMFSQIGHLNLHKPIHTGEKLFKCDQCNKIFWRTSHLIRHKRIHTGEKPFKCDQCDKMFSRADYLIQHKRIHTGEKPFKCDQCDKMFSHTSSVILHKRTHTGEKPFKCDHCDKLFSQTSSLIEHKRIHTGEKPFKCDHCDKLFSQTSSLIEHKRIHTGEKPFKCDQCDNMFSLKRYVVEHKRSHTGEKPFKCHQCDKMFSRKKTLIVHKRIHTGEKPFKCDQCDKTFSQSGHLIKHKRIHMR